MQGFYGRRGPPTPVVVPCYELQYLTSVTKAHTLPRSALEWTDTFERRDKMSEAKLGGRFTFPGT